MTFASRPLARWAFALIDQSSCARLQGSIAHPAHPTTLTHSAHRPYLSGPSVRSSITRATDPVHLRPDSNCPNPILPALHKDCIDIPGFCQQLAVRPQATQGHRVVWVDVLPPLETELRAICSSEGEQRSGLAPQRRHLNPHIPHGPVRRYAQYGSGSKSRPQVLRRSL